MDAAFKRLHIRRTRLVRIVQHAVINRLIWDATCRADDFDDLVDEITPPGVDADFVGAALGALQKRRIIRRLPGEPEGVTAGGRHSNLLRRWTLAVDHDTARRWLRSHPIPAPESDADQ